ncbi:MAG: hypothetical protein HZA90_11315 [Verrucomicrobia bacterium]|nr:hypothetical protein [Verrucomicrobiota bacterium]
MPAATLSVGRPYLVYLADNDRVGALEHYSQSIDTRAFLEGPPYTWSQVALAQLKRHPTWPPTP